MKRNSQYFPHCRVCFNVESWIYATVSKCIYPVRLQILKQDSDQRPFFNTWSTQYQTAINDVTKKSHGSRSGRTENASESHSRPPKDSPTGVLRTKCNPSEAGR